MSANEEALDSFNSNTVGNMHDNNAMLDEISVSMPLGITGEIAVNGKDADTGRYL